MGKKHASQYANFGWLPSGLVFSGTNNTNIDYTWNSNLPSTSWEFTGTIKTLSSSSTAQITFTN